MCRLRCGHVKALPVSRLPVFRRAPPPVRSPGLATLARTAPGTPTGRAPRPPRAGRPPKLGDPPYHPP
ncbi:hypothetical protein GCM10018782_46510 [Streptomyces griseoaurantiacus]|nr:hypothetical protein GCM10018782_46510 [Streptomyces griseoaurantiacus]